MWKFIDAIAANKALISREAARLYGGMYGMTCVVDFAFSTGSTSNIVNRILRGGAWISHRTTSAPSWPPSPGA